MTVRVLTALRDSAFDESVVRRINRADTGATVVRRCVDVLALRSAAGAGEADVAVIDRQLRGLERDVVAELHARAVRVVVVTADATAADHLGADVVVEPEAEAVLAALRGGLSAPSRTRTEPGQASGGRIIVVWGPTGAPGRTTVAIGVADELSRLGVDTALLDADTYGASVAVQMGLLDDSSGLAAACRLAAAGKLDVDAWRRVAVAIPSGLKVLTGLAHPRGWGELRPAAVDRVLEVTRASVATAVVDVGFCVEHDPLTWFEPGTPSRNQAAVACLGAADVVLAVTDASPVGLVRLVQTLPDVRSLAPTAVVRIVVNKVPRGRLREHEVREVLRRHLEANAEVLLPSDPASVASASAVGRTLAEASPRSALRQQLRGLAANLAGVPAPKGRRRAA